MTTPKRRKWKVETVAWPQLDNYLEEIEMDGYVVQSIIEQRAVQEEQMYDHVLVVAKDVKSSSKKHYYNV